MTLERARARLHAACLRAGRDPSEVTLVAVTKGQSPETIARELLAQGQRILGENRVQEWRTKAEELSGAEWHFIGNLQRNKVKYCLPFALIHSLASERLADELERVGAQQGHVFRVLLEVNVARESSKAGVLPEDAPRLAAYAQGLEHLSLEGLMTIAPYSDEPERARPYFRQLRELRDTLGLTQLSMGMSGDFEVAVEEGATLVRIGSALFAEPVTEGESA